MPEVDISAYRVILEPSGREFVAPAQVSLLEAGLHAGLMLPYGCENGSCGRCKARLLAGTTEAIGYQDYVLGEVERQGGELLLCRHAARSEVRLAVILADQQLLPMQAIKAKVEQIERLAADILILHLRTPRAQTLHFFAGQEVSLEFSPLLARRKSIASCPCNGMQLQFHFRFIPDDPISTQVFHQLAKGDTLILKGPLGHFLLDERSGRARVFIAYETGFAPVKSLIEHALALELPEPIHLYRLSRPEGIHYLSNYCQALGDAFDHLSCVNLEATDVQTDVATLLGRIAQDADLPTADIYAAVPPGWETPLRAALASAGVPETQIHLKTLERY